MLMQTHENRLAALREELGRLGLTGFVVPIADEHLSEYVGEYAQRLQWLTGFAGSAGSAIVLKNKAAIFVDGRYTVQVRDQVDEKLFSYVPLADMSMTDWIRANASEEDVIGYDAWLHTRSWAKEAGQAAARRGAKMVAVDGNPIDSVWSDQPEKPGAKLDVQPLEYAGKSHGEKRAEIAAWLEEEGYDATVLTALDSIAWTFNIRGGDISNTPVAIAHALVQADGTATLFVDETKLTDEVRTHLGNEVSVRGYDDYAASLANLAGKAVAVDPERAPAAIFEALDSAGAKIAEKRDPSVLMKAIKNQAEIDGHRAAQARDGAALARFLKWIVETAPKGGLDELTAAAKLRELRAEGGELRDISFRTISASGPHGALPHYSVNEETNREMQVGELYLVDSGGQYRDGTTDVTRVAAIGEPTTEMIKRYTQVLKGHIALDVAVFPKGTTGGALDTLARQFLWKDGVDYGHGTGHGVGAYLAVHEGPQRIAAFGGFAEPLKAGMICSNEPGYYKEGDFGIRIENLVLVEERAIDGAEKDMLGFETLTFAPLERELIDPSLLTDEERRWVDDYHARTLEVVGPQLDGEDREWLETRCAPLG